MLYQGRIISKKTPQQFKKPLQPCKLLIDIRQRMEVVSKPLMSNNFDHWQVFHIDVQMVQFLNYMQEFSYLKIGWKDKYMNILNLASLKRLDFIWTQLNWKECLITAIVSKIDDVIEINLGSEVNYKIMKLGKGCSPEERINRSPNQRIQGCLFLDIR